MNLDCTGVLFGLSLELNAMLLRQMLDCTGVLLDLALESAAVLLR